MNNLYIHPKCILCDNCGEIKLKEGYSISNLEENKISYFCSECTEDIYEQLKETVEDE